GDNTAAAAGQGAEIADEVERLLGGALQPVTGPIFAKLDQIDLPLNPPPSRDELEKIAAAGGPAGYNAQFQLAKLDRGESLLTKIDYPVQTWAFGDSLSMVFLGGEICVDYSVRLKKELDASRLWLHGYSNDFGCYIPSERLLKEGGYGGGGEIVYFALPNTLAPGLEQRIIDEVHKQIPPQFKNKAPAKADAAAEQQSSQQPLSLEEALASIKVNDRFVVEVAAAEPLIADPVAIDFGPDGRLWVAEMPDYSRFAEEEFTPTGSVRVLTDRDADGRYDDSVTFADGLRFPTDVKAWRNGVIVCDAPDVIYLEDADGDGKAEVRKVLLTGFETHNAQARVNSLRWGLDNWLYGSCGLFGGKIRTATGREYDLGGRDFRFRPDTGEFEGVTGKTQQGRARDDWGNWFGCENGSLVDHYPLVDHYLARNPHVVPPAAEVYVPAGANSYELYPIAAPTLFKLSGPPGRPTSACGLDFYRDELLGAEFANNSFVAEPVNQLVHRRVLSPEGASFAGTRAVDEVAVEFLASTDPWFRPVQIRTGPDGCLYVVDMHRAVIEHQKFIPQETLRELDLLAGREQGRIFRVRPRNEAARPVMRLDHLNVAGLAAALDSPNGPQRDMVQQRLVEQHAVTAVPILRKLARESKRPATRMQALCTLDGLQSLDAELLTAALADADPAVRRHAIRLSEGLLKQSPPLLKAALALVDDTHPQVQVQLAYSLGVLDDSNAAAALAKLALTRPDNPYLLAAIWSSVNSHNVGEVARQVIKAGLSDEAAAPLIGTAVKLVIELGDDDDVAAVIAALNIDGDAKTAGRRFDAAADLLEQSRQAADAALALEQQLAPLIAAAQVIVQDTGSNEGEQLAALRVLAARQTGADVLTEWLAPLLEPQNSPAVQQAAIKLASSIDDPSAGETLLAAWRGYTPAARAQVFDVMLGRAELTALLLEKIADGDVAAADLDALQRQRLLTHADEPTRTMAAAALAGAIDPHREEIVQKYVAAGDKGDAALGRQTFAKHCASCHRLEGEGHEVGPDLAALTSRTPAALIESILDPNRTVDERYQSYTALTAEGLALAGLLAGETTTSITLVEQQGKQHTLLRADLESLQNSGKSLMPEGFERDLTTTDVSNLLAYLNDVRPDPKKIEGNEPAVVTADYDGTLWLMAANCEIYGNHIEFEQPFQNIGFWYDATDYVAWSVELKQPGQYEAYLHWACAGDSAGDTFRIEGVQEPIKGQVGATDGYDQYQTRCLGRITLPAGESRITIRSDGARTKFNLMDLRGLYLVPVGANADRAIAGNAPAKGKDAATAIARLLDGLAIGTPAEYERIPQIWEQAITAGRRNDAAELVRILDLSLPKEGQPLADWQSVVVGGGVVNGVSQQGQWPRRRLVELLKNEPQLQMQWDRTLDLAVEMAGNSEVRSGTRYDALRILGAGDWQEQGRALVKYLAKDVHPELHMGAISGLSDVESPKVAEHLVAAFAHFNDQNRRIAIAALLRTEDRTKALQSAIESGAIPPDALTPEERDRLAAR
nr:HEAT repeat domain-containing protein [Pirellulales bacterium]